MAGERQTEPHQAEQRGGARTKVCCPGCGRTLGDVLESIVRQRGRFKAQREDARREVERLEAELARVRAERDEARETVGEWKLRVERAERERDEISASLAKMDAKWRHAYNRLRDYEDRGTTDQFSQTRRRAEAAEARAENQVAEIVALIRSYANVHMTKALADLIEHKYGGAGT